MPKNVCCNSLLSGGWCWRYNGDVITWTFSVCTHCSSSWLRIFDNSAVRHKSSPAIKKCQCDQCSAKVVDRASEAAQTTGFSSPRLSGSDWTPPPHHTAGRGECRVRRRRSGGGVWIGARISGKLCNCVCFIIIIF